ncbi:protein 60A-like [Anopheles bellator]|uniref:protein 60A-like n=1 Tax=Anopheles bellator TaxID=139047 RepID=UPI00264A1F32|nr:protein 60A-like [Anopheles bellator]
MHCVVILLTAITLVHSSGFYTDNGVDQTVREKSATPHEQEEIEHELLELLGLPDRPNKTHVHPSLRKSAPQFLLNIYHKFDEESNDVPRRRRKRSAAIGGNSLLTIADERAIGESDIIMSFLNKADRHLPKIRHHHRRLWFDTTEIAAGIDNQLLYASLRIYKNRSAIRPLDVLTRGRQITVRVSLIRGYDAAKERHRLEYVADHSVPYNYEGWVEINATKALHRWVVDGVGNKGVFVEVYYAESSHVIVLPHEVGLILSNKFGLYQPFLVGYWKGPELLKQTVDAGNAAAPAGQRSKRSLKHKSAAKRTERPSAHDLFRQWPSGPRALRRQGCQIRTLYVSFRQLNWHDWIIAPDGFGAFFCYGECNFPLNAQMNATNHALIQTLVHLIRPNRVPKPCCAPTKLNPISVLYHIDDANINLKRYKNMVVKRCGCL